jgi:antitoxin component YwqK of YwqJK toxin-antitoxin module
MKPIGSIIFFIFCSSISTLGQAALNQRDRAGKKHGKWVVYLDGRWKNLDDSSNALFKRYTWFDHGTNLYPMGPCGGKRYKVKLASPPSHNGPGTLDGEYTWYDKKGRISSVHVLKNGEYLSCKEYYASGGLHQHFDYTKKCENEKLGWTVFIYSKKGEITGTYPLCKDKNGKWPKTRG